MTLKKIGGEIVVASAATDASIAGQSDGSFFVAWEGPDLDSGEDPGHYNDVLGRAYDGATPLGAAYIINQELRDPQVNPDVAARPDGSYVVAYGSGNEDSLEGTFIATRLIGGDGTPIGDELFSENYTYFGFNPDVAVLDSGGFIVASADEFDYQTLGFSPGNVELTGQEFGSYEGATGHAATALDGNNYVVAWHGFGTPEEADEDILGLYVAVTNTAAGDDSGVTYLIVESTEEARDTDPVIATLLNGSVALVWTRSYESAPSQVFTAVFDPETGDVTTPTLVEGDFGEGKADIAVLADGRFVLTWADTGATGTGDTKGGHIGARIYNQDGSPAGDVFHVNTDYTGSQLAPTVAATGGSSFVIAWTTGGELKAQIFDAGAIGETLATEVDTKDGSAAANQSLTGAAGANAFYFDVAANSGKDTVTNFGKSDVLVTSAKLQDSNNDGIITFGANGLIDLDGSGGSSDTVKLTGINGSKGLRYLGEQDGLFVYADATVRPKGAIESKLSDDNLLGDLTDAKTNIFFFDTALELNLGDDAVGRFGAKDVIVTTNAIHASHLTAFATLDLGGAAYNSVSITALGGAAISNLEFDGSVIKGGVEYFVYSNVGSAVGVGALG